MADVSSRYLTLGKQLDALLDKDLPYISNLANFSALLWLELEEINWVGCYLADKAKKQLFLGPFQGKPACTSIQVGKGVCGTAFAEKQTQRIDNVHDFEGHIACDAASNSEIVIPLIKDGNYIGVLDIDSPSLSRFDSDDQTGLERIMASLAEHL